MRYIVLLILFFIPFKTKEASIPTIEYEVVSKADFRLSLKHILNHEGYYVNHPDDKGGETYAGITRKYNPDWYGWKYINEYKKKGDIVWNTHIPELDYWVLDYYLTIWVKEQFYVLKDQEVANNTLDIRINSPSTGVRIIQRTINQAGISIPITDKLDSLTIHSINHINDSIYLSILRQKRLIFYENIAKRDPSQKKFLSHWKKRTGI